MKKTYSGRTVSRLERRLGHRIEATGSQLCRWYREGLLPDNPLIYAEDVAERTVILPFLRHDATRNFKELQAIRFMLGVIDERVVLALRSIWLEKYLPMYSYFRSVGATPKPGETEVFLRRCDAVWLSRRGNRALFNLAPIPMPNPEWCYANLPEELRSMMFAPFESSSGGSMAAAVGQEPNQTVNPSTFCETLRRVNEFADVVDVEFLRDKAPQVQGKFGIPFELDRSWIDGAIPTVHDILDDLFREYLTA
jgi:hypothetical protein